MNSSSKTLTVLIGGVIVITLLAFLALSGVAATFAWMAGGYGSGPALCQAVTPGTGTSSPCVPASQVGTRVVAWAQAMANALYVNPTCGGRISYPDCYNTWYKAPGTDYPPGTPTFPQAVIQYGVQVCPGCSAWANGTYQCVSFVRGAYSQVYPMRLTANAFDLWAVYATQPGWMEILSASAPPGQRSIPMPLLPDLTVDSASWPGYTVWGYIRPSPAVAFAQRTSPSSQTQL